MEARYLTLKQAAATLPGENGQQKHWKTLERWSRDGIGGVKLRITWVGKLRCVTQEALDEFLSELSRRKGVVPESPAPRSRTRKLSKEPKWRKQARQRHGV